MKYEVIVVGGGHAGCEAALACSKKGHKTLLITSNIKNIADMPCNPSIGGTAKGIVVREIDALGGYMGKIADMSQIQIKMLNRGSGPAVRSLRAQADKITYPLNMKNALKSESNLTILEQMVSKLIVNKKVVKGVVLEDGNKIESEAVILTTGTYMAAQILVGNTKKSSGPHGEKSSIGLSDNLNKLGFKVIRLKTGTPPRIEKSSIDFSKTKVEEGDKELLAFSFDNTPCYKVENQVPCHLIYTNDITHRIIMDNLNKSSMYGGYVTGVGPRYCPSIEDKVVRFSDKERHQLFLEPESLHYDDIYIQGFSTSMPHDVQERLVHSLPGLEKAKINKYAYAIEYDAIYPMDLMPSLETKIIKNLFTAGQINGTSGYEEAAAQGLIAGINASLKLENKEPLILKRNEAYIGVLIDDLVTKGTNEPYRLLTSRAEYRLLLRHDNADLRLREYGYKCGLISDSVYDSFNSKKKDISSLINELKDVKVKVKRDKKVEDYYGESIYELLKRPTITFDSLYSEFGYVTGYSSEVLEQVEIQIKYEGYIKKTIREVENMLKLENKKMPEDIDYDAIKNLSLEAKDKLKKVKPLTLGQASRISGVDYADISVLLIYLRRYYEIS